MDLSQLTYSLPKSAIAHSPVKERDHSKLLTLNRNTGNIKDHQFFNLLDLLNENDVLVMNMTKVFPARLFAQNDKGKTIEILLLSEVRTDVWNAMHKGKVSEGDILKFTNVSAEVLEKDGYTITLGFQGDSHMLINKAGEVPLPPYIDNSQPKTKLQEIYQTVYAQEEGSVAAPTAGLHFTETLLKSLSEKGVHIEYLTLHVGAGTFLPIKETDITKHHMHFEKYRLDEDTALRLNQAKKNGKRIIAVGTTTTRVLESCANNGILQAGAGSTNIFIYPPYKFQFIDALITNFHLPHSTLLALVSAFVSKPNTSNPFTTFLESVVGNAYQHAIDHGYRFYSFGDAMLIE